MIIWPQGKQLSIKFDPFFRLEEDSDCKYDYLLVYSGISPDFPELLRSCGVVAPTDIVVNSDSNAVLVKFETDADNVVGCDVDGDVTCYGFKINFVTVDGMLYFVNYCLHFCRLY